MNKKSLKHLLRASSLSFSYGKEVLFERVDLSIAPGEVLGLIGPNGAGKTTLLKLLIGLLQPKHGRVESKAESLGYVPQANQLDPTFPLRTIDVVLMGAVAGLSFWGGYSKAQRERATELLKTFKLTSRIQSSFATLSGGERARALFARALMGEPEILFLDEPTASCDAGSKALIYEAVSKMRGVRSVVMVTHDLSQAIDCFDRVAVVNRGVEITDQKEVCEHFALGLYHTPLKEANCSQIKQQSKRQSNGRRKS